MLYERQSLSVEVYTGPLFSGPSRVSSLLTLNTISLQRVVFKESGGTPETETHQKI